MLGLALVLNLDDGLTTLVDDGEGEVFHISLNFGVIELASNETLSIEDGVGGVHGDLVLCGVTDETLSVGEGHIRGSGTVTLIIGNDLNTVVLPDTDT